MEHRKIARLLNLAGAIATIGIVFIFYVYPHLNLGGFAQFSIGRGDGTSDRAILAAIAGLPYLAALADYFRICADIARNRSFSRNNVRHMRRIARLLTLAAMLWLLALIVGLCADIPVYLILIDALATMATAAVALVAEMLARLLDRAVSLQEDSELTI